METKLIYSLYHNVIKECQIDEKKNGNENCNFCENGKIIKKHLQSAITLRLNIFFSSHICEWSKT